MTTPRWTTPPVVYIHSGKEKYVKEFLYFLYLKIIKLVSSLEV